MCTRGESQTVTSEMDVPVPVTVVKLPVGPVDGDVREDDPKDREEDEIEGEIVEAEMRY